MWYPNQDNSERESLPHAPRYRDAMYLLLLFVLCSFFFLPLFSPLSPSLKLFCAQCILFLFPPFLIVYTFRYRYRIAFSLRGASTTTVLFSVVAIFFGYVTLVGISIVYEGFLQFIGVDPVQSLESFQKTLKALFEENRYTAVLLITLMPAFCEEIFFRGLLLRSLYRKCGPIGSVLISALIFGLMHDPVRFLPTFLLGVFFGVLVIRTGSLLPAIVAHFINNMIAVEVMMLAEIFHWDEELTGSFAGDVFIWLLATALCAVVITQIFRSTRGVLYDRNEG